MAEPRTFDPEAILRILDESGVRYVLIGGLAATLYGSPFVTTDVDIAPDKSSENLHALAAALNRLDARIRKEGEAGGLQFDQSPAFLARASILNLTTLYGDLDLTFEPAGTQGYPDLSPRAVTLTIRGIDVPVAALADVIRSKEAANREKDRLTLPTLRRLLDRQQAGP